MQPGAVLFLFPQIKHLQNELEEVRNRAQQYEEEIAEESQGEDMELMSSQVSCCKIYFDK